ncbi:S-adenosylmethionine-dependent methyltransferase [Allopseudospirillum japonicum]|uniref:tRNA 5-carboxymethoxyuridine methyltransferase n=1 Tax=Allopseudospirillum japonicum TaxID=64971 RepID=A0A1H6QMB7_9GAMM|nr:methyltransferase domain-containing protein [Allopseudospirillum japonicum]SEI44911.1 S-adenosylmethionine-dependent methyltransferase [Allopseudospirillum japonicum]
MSLQQDRIFSGLAPKFARNIYASSKGELRLQIVKQRMQAELPLNTNKPLKILDLGAGLGHIAAWLDALGHEVTLVEPAEDMLAKARQQHPWQAASFYCTDIQGFVPYAQAQCWQYDLIVCHAVLEWLAEPQVTLQQALPLMAAQGYLSLMFFNRNALLFSNIVKGNYQKAWQEKLAGSGRRQRLTPTHPQEPQEVLAWLAAWELDILGVTGVRVFHDYLRHKQPTPEELAQVYALEEKYCQQEPFWRLGRYVHVSARHP